jgi:hypothetical protein
VVKRVALALGGCLFLVLMVLGARDLRGSQSGLNSVDIFEPTKANSVIASAVRELASSSALALIPEPMGVPPQINSGTIIQSNNLIFDTPWTSPPVEKTSTPRASFTFFNFGSGRIIETFASGASLSLIADGAKLSFLQGLHRESQSTASSVQGPYGHGFASNYDFVNAALNTTPSDLALNTSTLPDAVLAATAFLPTKNALMRSLATDLLPVQNVSAIRSFATPFVRGFEFDGTLSVATATYAISHILIFDASDTAHDLLVQGGTDSQINGLLSSLRVQTGM